MDFVLSKIKIVKKRHIVNLIRSILSAGIDIDAPTKIEELKFLVEIHRFINNRGKLRSYIEESKIIIETLWFDPLMSLEIDNGILSVIPTTDDEGVFSALSEILYFITFLEIKKKKPKPKKPKPDPNEFDWI